MGLSLRKGKKLCMLICLVVAVSWYLFYSRSEQRFSSLEVRQRPGNPAGYDWTASSVLHTGHPGLSTLSTKSNGAHSSTGLASTGFSSSMERKDTESIILERETASISENLEHTKKVSKVNDSVVELKNSECLEWVGLAPKPPYYLTAVLLVRIYEKDKAKLTTAEMKMWLQYLRYAGVEHVYIYDAFVYQSESQLPHLKEFLKDGYVTYIDWHTHNPYTISGTQVTAYQNCVNVYKNQCQWQAAIDIDEYPFSPLDQRPGFLSRYMRQYEKTHPQVSELSMRNFLFLGKPNSKELMIERVMRRTPGISNVLSKPIYKPFNIRSVNVHHNSISHGFTANAPVGELRMNHYWGARLQNWGEDTEETLRSTMPDTSMKPVIRAFKKCETFVRRYLQ